MKCPKCSYDNSKGIQFCVKCGSTIKLEYAKEINEKISLETKTEIDKSFTKEEKNKTLKNENQYIDNKTTEIKKEPLNKISKYLNIKKSKMEKNKTKEKFTYNVNQLNAKKNSDAALVIKIFIGIMIATTIFTIIGFSAYDGYDENTVINNYSDGYDYSDIKPNDDLKENVLIYNNIEIVFSVPTNLSLSEYSLENNKYYRDEKFTKSINYSIQKGDANALVTSLNSYYTSKSKNYTNVTKDNIKVGNHEFVYVKSTYQVDSYLSTTIVGYSQIGDYVYKVEYRDYSSGDVLSLDELFKCEIKEG